MSHYVAFRRHGQEWVLLDSFESRPVYGVSPSQYLQSFNVASFSAIWPQCRLTAEPEAGVAPTNATTNEQQLGQYWTALKQAARLSADGKHTVISDPVRINRARSAEALVKWASQKNHNWVTLSDEERQSLVAPARRSNK